LINLLEEEPINIAGVMFVAQPENAKQVSLELAAFPGAEVHEITDKGSMVVTIEENEFNKGVKGKGLIDTITDMSKLPGVISSSLIFHHNDYGLPQHQGTKV
jgi:nitrate reductase NapD